MKEGLISRSSSPNGVDLYGGLLGLHAFTGCDWISALASKGKVKRLELLLHQSDYVTLFKVGNW